MIMQIVYLIIFIAIITGSFALKAKGTIYVLLSWVAASASSILKGIDVSSVVISLLNSASYILLLVWLVMINRHCHKHVETGGEEQ